MSNPWLKHVKDYAEKNNISYACALSLKQCRETYKSKDDINKDQIKKVAEKFVDELRKMQDRDKPLLRMKYNRYNKDVKQYIDNSHSKLLKELLSK